jgi:hypothetical protein
MKAKSNDSSNIEMLLATFVSDEKDPFGNEFIKNLFGKISKEIEEVNNQQKLIET